MKITRKRQFKAAGLAVFLCSVLVGVTIGADSPSADNWVLSDTGTGSSVRILQGDSTSVTLQFAAQGNPPSPVVCDLLIGGADPSSVFTGDFASIGYSGVQFKINGDGTTPSSMSLLIIQRENSDIREWINNETGMSAVPGEWTINQIPLVREQGWSTDFPTVKRTAEQLWATDMADVQAMILRIVPGGIAAQAYSISDFQLIGPNGISAPARLSPLQAYFGVSSSDELTDEMLRLDSDGDGMSDYHEILAGLDPYDASSVLSAKVAVAPAANTISWEGVLGATYGVMRSNNLLEEFKLIANGRKPSFTGQVMTFEDADPVTGKPNYYKVVKY